MNSSPLDGVLLNRFRTRFDTLPLVSYFTVGFSFASDLRMLSWGLSFAQTQPSPRSVCVFFPCSTCVCLQLHVDILLRDIQGCRGKLRRKAYRGSWRVVSELKLFADCLTAFHSHHNAQQHSGSVGVDGQRLIRFTKDETDNTPSSFQHRAASTPW